MKKLFILSFGILFPLFTLSQNLPKKLSKQLCKCAENENAVNSEEINICIEKIFAKNLEDIYKHYNVNSIDDIDFETLGAEIGVYVTKNCDYINSILRDPNTKFEKGFKPEVDIDCSDFKEGEFYYLNRNIETKENDTTFVTIKDKMFLERMHNGNTYSLLDINWLNDCEFELVFKNSNDPIKNAFSKEGDKYKYVVVDSTPNSLIMKLIWNNQTYRIEFFKAI